jgi:hypothetical protein
VINLTSFDLVKYQPLRPRRGLKNDGSEQSIVSCWMWRRFVLQFQAGASQGEAVNRTSSSRMIPLLEALIQKIKYLQM